MGGVIGSSGGGYATVNPTQGNPMGEALQNVENSAFRYNAQRMNNEQARQENDINKQNRIDKQFEDRQKRDDKLQVESTGIQPVDVKIFETINILKNQASKAEEDYKKSQTDETKNVSYKSFSNANSSMSQIASFNEELKSRMNVVLENKGGVFDENSSKEVSANADKFNSGQWQLNVSPDNTITIDTFDLDDSGKFTKMTGRNMTPQQLFKKFTPRTAINYAGEGKGESALETFQKTIKVNKTADGKGNVIEEDANGIAKAQDFAERMSKDDNNVYKVRNLLGLPSKDEYNDADRKMVYDKSYSDALNLIPKKTVEPDYSMLNYSRGVRNDARVQSNSNRDFNQRANGTDSEGKVRVSTKDGLLGEETTVSETMTKSEYEKKKAEDAKVASANKKETSKTSNPFIDGVNKTFKSGNKAKTTNARKEISRSEISAKAKAAGYTTKEYEALLIKKGISIKS